MTFTFTFMGCSKDDDKSNTDFNNELIVGKWTITSINGTSPWRTIAVGKSLTFYSNGTCITEHSMENSWKNENGLIHTFYSKTLEPIRIYNLLSVDGTEYTVNVIGTLNESNMSVIVKMKK